MPIKVEFESIYSMCAAITATLANFLITSRINFSRNWNAPQSAQMHVANSIIIIIIGIIVVVVNGAFRRELGP